MVATDITAQRIETINARADDLLREQRVVRGTFTHLEKIFGGFDAKDLFAELVGEFALQSRFNNTGKFNFVGNLRRRRFADIKGSRNRDAARFAFFIEQVFIQDAFDGL